MITSVVILLNYNTSSDCRKCISYLRKQQKVDLEIVVVDNCSCKKDLCQLRTLCKEEQCTLIENKENRGYNAGNNIGLRYAANKGYAYALIANPDMEFPQTDYVAKLISVVEKDKRIVVGSSDILSSTGKHENPMRRIKYWEELLWPISMLRTIINHKYYLEDYNVSGYYEMVCGCCFLIRLSFVQQIGYFDEKTFLYCEESILSTQVELHNLKMYYHAGIQSIHRHIKREKGNPKKRMEIYRKSRRYYLQTYSGYSQWKLQLLYFSKKTEELFMKIYFHNAK